MRMFIECEGVELEVCFDLSKGYPETLETPEEHPEIIVEEVYCEGIDVYDLISEDKISIIEELLWDEISN